MHRLAVDPKIARYGGAIPFVQPEHVCAEHKAQSTAVDGKVKPNGLSTIYSALQRSPLPYLAMGNPRRVVRKAPFNGSVIRQLRRQRHLSLEQLAALVPHMEKANISKLERATTYVAMSWDNFLDLARALYVAPEELRRRLSESSPSAPPSVSPRGTQRA